MPIVEVSLASGRSPEQIRSLISHLTAAVVESIGAPLEAVRVLVREVSPDHWAVGDTTLAERQSINEKVADSA